MEPVSDEELISRIRNGDTPALDTLVDKYLPITYGWVRKLVSIEDVEDVSQDIFLGLIRGIHSFKGQSTFRTWFYRVVSNQIADYHRKEYRRKDHADDYRERILELSTEAVDDDHQSFLMADMLKAFPENYREILLMRFYQGMTYGEIASTLGMEYEAARSRYRRAIDYARKLMA